MVKYVELAGRYAGPPERVQGLQRLAIEHPDSRGAPAGDVQEALRRIRREGRAGGCVAVVATTSYPQAPAIDPYLRYIFAVGGEHLHALAAAVGDIHEPVIRDFDAVNGRHKLRRPRVFRIEPGGQRARLFLFRRRGPCRFSRQCRRARGVVHRSVAERAPHAFVRTSVRIEHDDAFVAVAVGDENLIGLGIDENVGRLPKAGCIRVALLLRGMTDLHYEFAVFRELQDLVVVPIAADPDVSFVVHGNSMLSRWPGVAISRLATPALNVV